MRRAVLSDEACAVEREDDVQVLQTDVVQDLVVSTLGKRRIEREHGLPARRRKACSKRRRMLLSDAHIEEARRILLAKRAQTRAVGHRRRDGDDIRVLFGGFQQSLAEDTRVRRLRARLLQRRAVGNVESADAVELVRRLLRRRIALSLARLHMNEQGTL